MQSLREEFIKIKDALPKPQAISTPQQIVEDYRWLSLAGDRAALAKQKSDLIADMWTMIDAGRKLKLKPALTDIYMRKSIKEAHDAYGGCEYVTKELKAKNPSEIELLKSTDEYKNLLAYCAEKNIDVKVEIELQTSGAMPFKLKITFDQPFSASPDAALLQPKNKALKAK